MSEIAQMLQRACGILNDTITMFEQHCKHTPYKDVRKVNGTVVPSRKQIGDRLIETRTKLDCAISLLERVQVK